MYQILLYVKGNPSILISSFLVGFYHTDRFQGNGPSRVFFSFKSRQIYLQLKLLKKHVKYPSLRIEEDDDELANSKTNERIVRQPTYIRAWTPLAQHVQVFWIRKYICANSFKLSKINKEENETATFSSFLHLFTLHVTKTFSFKTFGRCSIIFFQSCGSW